MENQKGATVEEKIEEVEEIKEELNDDDLENVTGGLAGGSIRKRDVHGKPLTTGPEGYIRPLKG